MTKFGRRIIGTALCIAALTACGGGDQGAQPFLVTYSVSGTGPFDVTYTLLNGDTSQQRAATSYGMTFAAGGGEFLYISAQTNSSSPSATVNATITVDGRTFKSATSSGPFVIATASGRCC